MYKCHLCGETGETWIGIIHDGKCPERPEHPGYPPKEYNGHNCDLSDATSNVVRKFESGAIRDSNEDKLDFESTFDPLTMESFAKFIHKHNKLPDGSMRPEDNWQKGIPKKEYMKSLFRHFMQAWKIHRGHKAFDNHGEVTMEDALNGIIFNARGYLFEILNGR